MTHSISRALIWAVYAQGFSVRLLLADLGNSQPWHHFHFPPLISLTLGFSFNIWDVGNLWAWRNPFLLDAVPCFLKDLTSKTVHMEMTHMVVPRVQILQLKYHVDRFKTGYELDRSMFITDGRVLEEQW